MKPACLFIVTAACVLAVSSSIAICNPGNGSWQMSQINFLVNGSSGIQAYNDYLNGNLFYQSSGRIVDAVTSLNPSANAYTVVFKGYDSQGHVYQQSSTFHVFYSYSCGPDTCSPGIIVNSPADYADVSSPFVVNAETYQPPHPIASMKVYLDNTVVGTSTGPTIYATVPGAHGTHLLTVQAWDTTGALYRTQQTVNIQ